MDPCPLREASLCRDDRHLTHPLLVLYHIPQGRMYAAMTYRPKNLEERTLHRLKIARGHLDKVIKMVESQEYCIDVINQSQAVQAALKEIDSLLLENHLVNCVAKDIHDGHGKNSLEEVMKVFKRAS